MTLDGSLWVEYALVESRAPSLMTAFDHFFFWRHEAVDNLTCRGCGRFLFRTGLSKLEPKARPTISSTPKPLSLWSAQLKILRLVK